MMYSNKFVAAVKVNGQVLRESANVVTLPFGSEYSVLLKNLNSVRSLVKVSVDGKDATEGTWLIVPANGSLELERFIRDGNFERGNRFKFIERTQGIEDHRGVGAEDGLIRVEYKVEHVQPVVDVPIRRHYDEWVPVPRPWPRPCPPTYPRRPMSPTMDSRRPMHPTRSMPLRASASAGPSRKAMRSMPTMDSAFSQREVKLSFSGGEQERANDAGITVPGSASNQRFVTGEYFPTEDHSEVIVLKLRGALAGKVVVKAVTVSHKPKCQTCGTTNKAAHEFCSKCGTALSLI